MNTLPSLFDALPDDGDSLSSGLTGGYAVLSIRSSRFRLKYQGSEKMVMDGNNPAASIDVVLVKASPALAKVYYKNGYADGSDDAPDCHSNDGVKPDLSATAPQCATCAACLHNVIGSRVTPNGSKVKACADSRRIAIVPAQDMKNVDYGGPMLLRVPAGSLGNLADYGRALKQRGFKPAQVVTRLSFDVEASYPKLVFTPARMVSNDEVGTVLEHLSQPKIGLICSENAGVALPPPAAAAPVAIAPPAQPQVVIPAPIVQPAPVQQAPVAPPADPFAVLGTAAAVAVPTPATPPPAPAPKPAADPFAALGAPATTVQPAVPPPVSTSPAPAAASGNLENDIKSLLAKLDAK